MIHTLGLAIGLVAASAASAAPAPERFTAKQREAQFYFDLGPDSLDVSGYPEAQRKNYEVFSAVCSRCHTLARPIGSPLATRADWRRYVRRMHVRSKDQAGKLFTKEQARSIVEFLAYDSSVRKIAHKAAFDEQTERLKKLFAEVRGERSRLQMENDAKNARPYSDQNSVTPRP